MSQPTEERPKKTFHGSCHCKFIQYTVNLQPGTASRCNCTVCLKSGFTGYQIAEDDFTLVSPASFDDIPDYQPNAKHIHRYYCKNCGVQILTKGYFTVPTDESKKVDFRSVNLLTLDQPQEGLDLRDWNLIYYDGRNNNWMAGATDEPWENGCK